MLMLSMMRDVIEREPLSRLHFLWMARVINIDPIIDNRPGIFGTMAIASTNHAGGGGGISVDDIVVYYFWQCVQTKRFLIQFLSQVKCESGYVMAKYIDDY